MTRQSKHNAGTGATGASPRPRWSTFGAFALVLLGAAGALLPPLEGKPASAATAPIPMAARPGPPALEAHIAELRTWIAYDGTTVPPDRSDGRRRSTPPTTAQAPVRTVVRTSPPVASTHSTVTTSNTATAGPAYGCAAALAWLAAHAVPGFQLSCPGYAYGHQAVTCYHVASLCPGSAFIRIADPCPAAYMNEASNSWVLIGRRSGPIDPYGACR